ncbi:hypothetical protein AX16_000823 [Volvariella volvacea WC 439]|nr:hypothetical protein AX16_000823 [Volvariella volvacea WC 439]
MSKHVPGSASVCIHSVCVKANYRRRGVGLALLKAYIDHLTMLCDNGAGHERVLLITHSNLRSFYEKAGFEWIGASQVAHGSQPWFEMRKVLASQGADLVSTTQVSPVIPAGLWEALAGSSRKERPAARSWNAFSGGRADVTVVEDTNTLINKFDIVCPRDGCGSLILKKGTSKWVESKSIEASDLVILT